MYQIKGSGKTKYEAEIVFHDSQATSAPGSANISQLKRDCNDESELEDLGLNDSFRRYCNHAQISYGLATAILQSDCGLRDIPWRSFRHVAFDDAPSSRLASVKRDATETSIVRKASFPSKARTSTISTILTVAERAIRLSNSKTSWKVEHWKKTEDF